MRIPRRWFSHLLRSILRGPYALHPYAEGGLQKLVAEASSGDVLPEAAVAKALPKEALGVPHKEMVQDVQLQTFDAAHGLVVQEPVNSDHVLPSRLAYGESRPDLDRLLEFFRLPLDLGGVRFRTVLGSVVVQVGGEEIEPLRLIVVAVEEDLGVAGVVLRRATRERGMVGP
jgi:hypothetical protein